MKAERVGEPLIVCEDVHKWYAPDFEVLKGVSYDFYKGEVTVIIGTSGSGKSTFLRAINGLEEHQSGRIRVGGIELTHNVRNLNAIRNQCGMVFQSFNLFPHLSVMENITLAPIWVKKYSKAKAQARASELLEIGRAHV